MPKGDSRKGQWSEQSKEKRRQTAFENNKTNKSIPRHWDKKDHSDFNDFLTERSYSDNEVAKQKYPRGYQLHKERDRFNAKKTQGYEKASQLATERTPTWVWETTSNEDWQSQNEVGSPSSPARETQVEVGSPSSPARETQIQSFPEQWSSIHDEQTQEAMHAYNRHYGVSNPREWHWTDDI